MRSRVSVKLLLASALLMGYSVATLAAAAPDMKSVAGNWVTFDAKTKKPSSVINISQKGNVYVGKIAKTYPAPGEKSDSLCTACHGKEKNQPYLGLEIIKNMVCVPGSCKGGTIMDPRDGKVYQATLTLMKGGKYLKVHGYIGVPLLGQTVVWQRLN